MVDLSICIVTYRARDFLHDCLKSIAEFSGSALTNEIIVVDNHSNDGTLEMLRSEFPRVTLIANQENAGYTRPNNQAMRISSGRYILLINPDCLVEEGAMDGLAAFLDQHPEVGIVGPKVLNRDRTLQKQCRRSEAGPWDAFCYFSGLANLFPNDKRFAGYLMTYMDENILHEVQAVSGSCMLIRREVIEQIGYLDENFFAYQEDSDFCRRARLAGWKVFYYPDSRVVHFAGEGGSGVKPFRSIYEWHRSYYLYYRKHFSDDYFFLLNWVYYLAMTLKLAFSLLTNLFRRKKVVGTKKP